MLWRSSDHGQTDVLDGSCYPHPVGGLFRHSGDGLHPDPVVCYPDEPLRLVVYRMAETGFTRLPVVEDPSSQKLVGMVSLGMIC